MEEGCKGWGPIACCPRPGGGPCVCGGGGKGRAASDRGEMTTHTMADHHGPAHKGREKAGN
jgi:hypothetical protein